VRRFFIDPDDFNNDTTSLTGDEFHHLRNVSRLGEGEFVELLDAAGRIADAKIVKIGKKSADLQILSRKSLPPPPHPHIEIVLCLPRFQKMDFIIQKAAELGVSKITPVVSERSFIKKLSKEVTQKISRWEKISMEACKQSGRAWPLHWGTPGELNSVIRERTGRPAIFLYEGTASLDIKTALSELSQAPENITVFIGAEGGFSPQELENFQACGFKPVTLGPLVLRVETACIAIISVIEYHFGLMR
jgi:16S rRNA (uracil1498-N3)-methyltransferase